jgi:hypothetical protein
MPTIWTGSVPAREAGEKPPDGVRGPALRFGDLRATGASAPGEHGEDISLLCVRSRARWAAGCLLSASTASAASTG